MKLISLNAWGGKVSKPFFDFLSDNQDVDIFCFQEVFHDLNESGLSTDYFINKDDARMQLFDEIKNTLPEHEGYFCPIHSKWYGLAIFIKKGILVTEEGNILLYENPNYNPEENTDHDRKLQWIKILAGESVEKNRKDNSATEKEFVIMNIHGHWTGNGKGDTEERIHQSKQITDLLHRFSNTPRILCGDFNLRPDTDSVKMIENIGMHNLITKHNIKSTRTSLYTGSEPYADFIFVSPEVEQMNFKVMPDEVSDHSALYIEFK